MAGVKRGLDLFGVLVLSFAAANSAATVVVIGRSLQLPVAPETIAALILCFGLRVMAIRYRWQLPVAKFAKQSDLTTKDGKNPESF